MYLVEMERWGTSCSTREELENASEVLAKLRTATRDLQFLVVADIRNGVDWGNFLIWLRGDRALVRLDQHRDHHATDASIRERLDERSASRPAATASRYRLPGRSRRPRHWMRWSSG